MSAITHDEITHGKYSIFCGRDPESEIGDPEKYMCRAEWGSASYSGLISGVRVLSPALSGVQPGFRGG